MTPARPPPSPCCPSTKLEVAYGGIQAVKGIDLHVDQGELVCLIGANGAGKTTTLKGICGLLPVKAGKIRYAGADVTGKPAFQLVKRGLAMVPEGRGVFGALTIEENLAMGAYIRNDAAGIRADIERVYGLFPRLKERRRQTAGTLSGGEQQMLAMGRAMLSRPKLLLLDEPSMGLAPLMVQKVFETIVTISGEGVTILLIEQNAKLALEVSRRGYVMESGEITIAGAVRIAAARPEGARRVSRRDRVAGEGRPAPALVPEQGQVRISANIGGRADTRKFEPGPFALSPPMQPEPPPRLRRRARRARCRRRARSPGTAKRCACGSAARPRSAASRSSCCVASVALEPVPVAGFVVRERARTAPRVRPALREPRRGPRRPAALARISSRCSRRRCRRGRPWSPPGSCRSPSERWSRGSWPA